MDLIEKLFYSINTEDRAGNPFEAKEARRAYDIFCDKYLTELSNDKVDEVWDKLGDVVFEAQLNSFKIGFNTAKELLR